MSAVSRNKFNLDKKSGEAVEELGAGTD